MAMLTQKDFRGKHGETRIVALIEKLTEGIKSPFTRNDGKQLPFNRISYPDPKSGQLVSKNATDLADSADIATVIRGGLVGFKQITLSYQRGGDVSNATALSNIMKTEDFGGKSNRGDMAEVIFSAAIAARFVNKNQAIIEADVADMIKMLNDTDTKQLIGPLKSQNKEPKVVDDLYWEINTALINIKALKNPKHAKSLKTIIQTSVKYANSATVANNAKIIYENNLYNRIDVKAVGIVAQNDTKVDVYVEIDKQKVDINVSLKAAGAKQFGQVGGGGIDKQKELWNTLLDIKMTPILEKKYFDILKSDGVIQANAVVYKGMAEEFKRRLTTNKRALYESLADGIQFFGTRNDPTVTMVALTSKEAMIYKFTNLAESLKLLSRDLTAVYIDNKAKPEVRIQDSKTGAVLITVRMKVESKNNYIRHYIEKGKMMTELSAVIAA